MRIINRINVLGTIATFLALNVSIVQASLVVDFRATGATGTGTFVNSKSVTVSAAGNGTVTFDVYLTVRGANATGADDEANLAQFGATSYDIGGGKVFGDATTGMIAMTAPAAPWNGSGASAGTAQVLLATQPTGTPVATFFYDGDADRDVGGGAQTSSTGWIAVRGTGVGGFNGTTAGNPGTLVGEGVAGAGMEWKIGTITYSWNNFVAGAGTTQLNAVLRTAASGGSWREDSTSGSVNPTTAGATYTRGTAIVLSTAGGGGATATTYTLGVTAGATNVLKGGTTTLSTTITNTGTGTADTLNFTGLGATTTVGATINNATTSGGPLAQAAASSNAGQTFTSSTYGSYVVTSAVGTATNATAGGNATLSGSAGTVTINVGNATAAATPLSTNLYTFAPGNALSASIAANGSYAGLSSRTTRTNGNTATPSAAGESLGTEAIIIEGTASGNAETVSMNWRVRAPSEFPTTATFLPVQGAAGTNPSKFGAYSDIVEISGMSGSTPGSGGSNHTQTNKYVLQMSFQASDLAATAAATGKTVAQLAADGFIYLGWLDTKGTASTADDLWRNAVEGNFTGIPFQGHGFVDTFANYKAGTLSVNHIAKTGGTTVVGDWGVDLTTNTVWAVLDHNSQFAVLPEPSSIAILGAGLVGVIASVRRRRRRA